MSGGKPVGIAYRRRRRTHDAPTRNSIATHASGAMASEEDPEPAPVLGRLDATTMVSGTTVVPGSGGPGTGESAAAQVMTASSESTKTCSSSYTVTLAPNPSRRRRFRNVPHAPDSLRASGDFRPLLDRFRYAPVSAPSAAMCAVPMPQQPPTIVAPASAHCRAKARYVSGVRSSRMSQRPVLAAIFFVSGTKALA